MRRIDLTCLIASPIMAGLLLTYGNLQVAILAIMVMLQPCETDTLLLQDKFLQNLLLSHVHKCQAGFCLSCTALMLQAWNMFAWLPECWFLRMAQQLSPALRCAKEFSMLLLKFLSLCLKP